MGRLTNAMLREVGELPQIIVDEELEGGPKISFKYTVQSHNMLNSQAFGRNTSPDTVYISGCMCIGICGRLTCPCVKDKENNFNKSGKLTYHKRPIYQCGPKCACNPEHCIQQVMLFSAATETCHNFELTSMATM